MNHLLITTAQLLAIRRTLSFYMHTVAAYTGDSAVKADEAARALSKDGGEDARYALEDVLRIEGMTVEEMDAYDNAPSPTTAELEAASVAVSKRILTAGERLDP